MESPYSTARPEWTESHLCNLLVKYKNIILISVVWFWMATEMLYHVIPKTLKMVLDISSLNTQQYKVRIKGKVEQFREKSSALFYTSV